MLDSQLEIVQQAKQFLRDIHIDEYTATVTPHFSGSAGAHMRHVLDHYLALMHGFDSGLVDYNKRNRFSEVESCPKSAMAIWDEIESWLSNICAQPMDAPLQVMSETCIFETQFAQVPSTLARELVFVSSHAIHHFSLLAVIRSLQGKTTPEYFGIAPATATFIRQQA
ncbi:MAG: hypothetical protein Alis3KO_28240 [Aliiglaciecola sp.]|uniref:hypothetical protein n=1 Tax=Aliiglaciecola sp. M165 TaxID=2593649 RepID=UPI00117F7504|nr:hypothetical protein [Aliiglaciecola sp. M165]TRY33715.1 hypothetical protein FM019_00180 [Aliiglaciecola sp. M165]